MMMAGSAGGGEPPHGHSLRLPSDCQTGDQIDDHTVEGDNDTVPIPKARGRRRALGLKTIHRRETSGPIPLTWDESAWKAVDTEGQLLSSNVGIQVRTYCDPSFEKWADVPKAQKDAAFQMIADYFQVDITNSTIEAVLNRDASFRYKDWKYDLNQHFKKFGGENDLARFRANRPDTINDQVIWEKVINRLVDKKFKTRSKKNSENRAKQLYPSRHGRVSMAGHTHKSMGKSKVNTWADLHVFPDGKPVNDIAGAKISELTDKVTQASSCGSGPVDEASIFAEVLGSSRGFRTGIGPVLPGHSSSRSSRSRSCTQTDRSHKEWEARALRAEAKSDRATKTVNALKSILRQNFPDLEIPPSDPDSPEGLDDFEETGDNDF